MSENVKPERDYSKWRVVHWAPKYQVSNDGDVRGQSGRLLTPTRNRDGYLAVSLYRGPRDYRLVRIHTLVLEAFVGLRPAGMECCHLNGKRDDNRAENLRWGTLRENQRMKIEHGTAAGAANGRARFTTEDVKSIRSAVAAGTTQRSLAAKYRVAKGTISHIVTRRNWRHVR